MQKPTYRTYIFLVILIVAMLIGWKYCSDHNTKTTAGSGVIGSGSPNKPDH